MSIRAFATSLFLSALLGTGCLPDQGGKVEHRKKSNPALADSGNADPCNQQSTSTDSDHPHGEVSQSGTLLNEDHGVGHGDEHPPSTSPSPNSGTTGTNSGSTTTSTDCQKQGSTSTIDSGSKDGKTSHLHIN